MTLQEVRQAIEATKEKRDIMNELTPANKEILSRRNGTFEAVLTGKGAEKCLIPEVGVLHFLYRGQNEEFLPCLPTIYRNEPNDAMVFIERMKLIQFERLLKTHPVVTQFFEKHNFLIDTEGLAQHYGLKTEVLDLTSSLDVALFFATCKYDRTTDTYDYYHDEGGIHEGVLYVFDPIFDNEPAPPFRVEKYLQGNITPIGLQAFPRPGAQYGYALHLAKGKSTKCWMFRFTFTSEESKHYYHLFREGETLWIKDRLVSKTKQISDNKVFSFSVFNETFEKFRPKGWSRTKMKTALKNENIVLLPNHADVTFSSDEQKYIVEEWNNSLGEAMCKNIVRKFWLEREESDDNIVDQSDWTNEMQNRHEFNTLNHIADIMMLHFIANFEGPEGAEWKNYMNTPSPTERISSENSQWKKISGSMNSVFGKTYLTEKDWKISIK